MDEILKVRPLRHPDLAWRSWDGEVVILSPAGHDPAAPELQRDGAEHDLNEVGSRIWEMCDGSHTVAEMVAAVVEEFEIDEATAQADAVEFVRGLLAQKLLVGAP